MLYSHGSSKCKSIHIFLHTVVLVGFEENQYTVAEGGPALDICLQLLQLPPNSPLGTPVIIRVMSTGLSATGTDCMITVLNRYG